MKNLCFIIVFSISLNCFAQDFSAYSKISNQDFKEFTGLFQQKELPLDSDYLLDNYTFYDMNYQGIPSKFWKFIMKEHQLIPGPLYTIDDEASPNGIAKIDGCLHPLYKLPTNGDYVILVFAQTSEIEDYCRVFAYSFDLKGDFINSILYLYMPKSQFIYSSIDKNLYTHQIYPLYDRSDPDKIPGNEVFVAQKAHLKHEINTKGEVVFKSIDKKEGVEFKYNGKTKLYEIIN